MKAMLMTAAGGAEVLQMRDIDMPELPSPQHIRVKLAAAGINPIDTKLRKNPTFHPDKLPCILGCDGAGIVESIGAEVTRFKVGEEVYFFNGGLGNEIGTYAEYTVVHQDYAAFTPRHATLEESAGLPLALITAWEALLDRGNLLEGQTVLIHGAAGGVGHLAVQIAKQAGATVLATVGTRDKAAWVTSLGADRVFVYNDVDFATAVLDWTKGNGVDLVFDTVGGETFCRSFACTRVYGRIVSLLQWDCSAEDLKIARTRNLVLAFVLMLTPTLLDMHDQRVHQRRILEEGARLIEANRLKIKISHLLPLAQAAQAHTMIEEGHTTGKIVLQIS